MTTHNVYTLLNSEATQVTPNGIHSGMDITIQNNNDAGNIFVGGAGVTTTDYGYKLFPGHAISFELSGQDDLFVVAEQSPATVAVLSMNLEQGN